MLGFAKEGLEYDFQNRSHLHNEFKFSLLILMSAATVDTCTFWTTARLHLDFPIDFEEILREVGRFASLRCVW